MVMVVEVDNVEVAVVVVLHLVEVAVGPRQDILRVGGIFCILRICRYRFPFF